MAKTTKTPSISAAFILAAAIVLVAFPIKTSALSPAAAPGSSGGVAAAPGPFSGAPGPALDCVSYLSNLTDCLSYVGAGSNQNKPDKACCPELANLVATQPVCLCELLAHPERSPLPIDLPKAMGLPAICKVDASPSSCSGLGVPVGAPAPAPASASAGGPLGSSPETSSPEGSASSPTSPKNGGQSTTATQRHSLVGLAIALFISFF
ncbi:non-specific lipid transfer protein GPI-anchored 4-like [Coffea arabica]|uniref:Non-specific lipid transfer protein GPI-anchored 4-like n=1 Tax=Coffea arabica TaxID=13443 RepID=A0A6P6TSR2_COFAR|nr:non-specific lipid-transfer protein-like protein At2g13820 [Coffea arabica]